MSWTEPRTWVTGEIVTAAQLNEQVRDNIDFVHDALPSNTQTVTSNVLGTVYQNTTSAMKFVTVTIGHILAGAGQSARNVAYVKSTSSPDTEVAEIYSEYGSAITSYRLSMTFCVPAGYYYKVTDEDSGGGTSTLLKWTEW
ncbi:hypothetical protein ASJ33_05665 [Dehalococcoides mccartyi]|jgi:hypothetical protein|uniref:hypothetical protein n=1 Tax=Dehalococcoides mccartyi TaxID=61435 RepID=UPI0004E053A2|nr:hypothetical protein [Dehalococcoides mccartyi]AII58746.1 hypothetical protein X792_05110 [Dehalococcoides mccartyi CG1]APH12676.1 hypothetical protein ASJ33_05665 [Dehalococcoides mccartyi]